MNTFLELYFLLDSLKQLSIATEEQVAIIKSLTEQNKLQQDWRQIQETLLNKTAELQHFKGDEVYLSNRIK